MAEPKDPSDRQYDWLYPGGPEHDKGARSGADRPAPPTTSDPEATQLIQRARPVAQPAPTSGGPRSSPLNRPANQAPGPEPSRVISRQQPPTTQDRSRATAPLASKRGRWWLRGIVAVLAGWLIFLVVIPFWAWSKVDKVDADPGGTRPDDTPGTTYLLVGADARPGLSGSRTDTIMLLHVPSGDGPKLLLSIPRDSYVDIPGRGKNKVNAAYAFGGPALLVQTVEAATGLRIDDYVEIGFSGFVGLIDAVGGVRICPTERMRDQKADLNIQKGCQDADGATALGFARSRQFSKGDITRIRHQREVVTQTAGKVASWKSVVLPWRYVKVSSAGAKSLHVGENVGVIDITRFAWAVSHMSGKDGLRCVVPYSSLSASTNAGSAVLWDEQKANAIFQAVREDDTSAIKCSEE